MKQLSNFYNRLINQRTKTHKLFLVYFGVFFLSLFLAINEYRPFSIVLSIIVGLLLLKYHNKIQVIQKIDAIVIIIFCSNLQ